MKKIISATLAAVLAAPVFASPVSIQETPPAVQAAQLSFSDIGTLSAEDTQKIEDLVAKGVISGFPDGTFRPHQKVTRGEYAALISKALNLPMPQQPKSFSDVTNRVSTYEGIMKAYEAGIVSGFPDGRFRPQQDISRSDMAIMLDNVLQINGSYIETAALSYADKGSIGRSALPAVQRLTYYGIMKALKDNAFAPNEKGTRLATVTSIWQLLEVIESGAEPVQPEEPAPAPVPNTPEQSMTEEEARKLYEKGEPFVYKGFQFTPTNGVNSKGERLYESDAYISLDVFPSDVEQRVVQKNVFYSFGFTPEMKEKALITSAFSYLIFRGVDMTKDEFISVLEGLALNEQKTINGVMFAKLVDNEYSIKILE